MSKKNIMVLRSDNSGVGFFRSLQPHINLEKIYPDEFHVEMYAPNEINFNDDNFLKRFDLIHYHRTMCEYDQMPPLIDKLKKLGIKMIMDLDDFFFPHKLHPAFHMIQQSGLGKKILNNVQSAQFITTTTPVFADLIKKYNKNVFVLPNTIDPTMDQFIPKKIEREKIAVGYLAGSSHLVDLEEIQGLFQRLRVDNNLKNKFQVILCGFDLRGSHTNVNTQTGKQETRPILPKETSWYLYEKLFTDDYRMIEDKKYLDFLMKFKREDYPNEENMTYRRVWTKLLKKYAENYNLMDISLAPLSYKGGEFNISKSQLKLIEGAFHKKAVICTSYAPKIGPYDIDGVHEKNCILIPERKNHKDWFKYTKKLIESPAMREDLGNQLYEDFHIKYHIDTDSKNRRELYLNLLK
mgnify:FL=1